jgi:predicted unusual protein kinase regulating ubiquinone biosynthesis (AarF/ABC1/UbiB family)
MLDNAPRHACTDPMKLQEDMHEIVSAIPLENLGRVDLGKLLSEVMNTVRKHHVKLESDFASLVISLAIIEGIGRQLDPELSLFHEAVPVMLKDRDTRKILLETAGVRACAKLGLVIAKEEYHHLTSQR